MAAWTLAILLAQPPAQAAVTADQDIYGFILGGWATARAMARDGGGQPGMAALLDRSLRRINEWLTEAQRGTTPRDAIRVLELQYADATIRAALSAAQDEREELALYLVHARDLSQRVGLLGGAARWPLPIDEVDGELWYEVDRYQEARDAYQRAVSTAPSPRAWIGLARASTMMGDVPGACAAYRTALLGAVSPEWEVEATRYIAASCGADSRLPAPGSRP